MIYKLASKKKNNSIEPLVVGSAAAGLTGAGIGVGVSKGFNVLNKHFEHPKLTEDRVHEIYNHVGGKKQLAFDRINTNGLNADTHLIIDKGPRNPLHSMYAHTKELGKKPIPTILVSEHSPESIVAHEMGHSTSKFINNKAGLVAYGLSKKFTPMVGVGAGIRYAQARARGASKAELDKIKKQDNIAAAVTSLPMVGEETRANLVALRAMKRMGQLNKRNLIPLAISEASYLGMPAMTPIAHKLVDKYYDWKQKK